MDQKTKQFWCHYLAGRLSPNPRVALGRFRTHAVSGHILYKTCFGSGSCSLWRFTFTRLCSASGSVTSGIVRTQSTDETRKNLCRQASLHGTIRTCHHALRAPQAIRRGGLRGRRERPELLYGGFGSFKKPAGVYRLPVDAPESHVLRTVGRPRGGKTCL